MLWSAPHFPSAPVAPGTRLRRLCAAVLIVLYPLYLAPAHGQERTEALFNLITLQAQAEREVANDTLTAMLSSEAEGSDPAAMAAGINRAMRDALETARGYKSVNARTMNYQTFPVYDKAKIVRWRVRQELRLESRDFAQVTELIGKLQARAQSGLLVTALSTGVSKEARTQAENALIGEALAAFHERAAIVRTAQKASSYRVKELHVGANNAAPPRPMAMARMATAEAAPAVEAGTSLVQVSVNGTIQMQ